MPTPREFGLQFAAVISMPKDQARRERSIVSAPVDLQVVPGVAVQPHADHEPFDTVRARDRYGRQLLPGEVGCALAHLNALRSFLRATDGSPAQTLALIAEDDALWTEGAGPALQAVAALPHELTFLFSNHPYRRREIRTVDTALTGLEVVRPVPMARGAVAYLVSRSAASIIVQRTGRPFWIADDYQAFREMGIDVRSVVDFPVTVQHVPSTVDDSSARQQGFSDLRPRSTFLRGRKSFLTRFGSVSDRRLERWHRAAGGYARLPLGVRASPAGRALSMAINDAATGHLLPQRLAARLR